MKSSEDIDKDSMSVLREKKIYNTIWIGIVECVSVKWWLEFTKSILYISKCIEVESYGCLS